MKEYKVETIKDIFDKIPRERLHVFMVELEQAIIQSQAVRDAIGGKLAFSGEISWKDDGLGEITSNFVHEEEA